MRSRVAWWWQRQPSYQTVEVQAFAIELVEGPVIGLVDEGSSGAFEVVDDLPVRVRLAVHVCPRDGAFLTICTTTPSDDLARCDQLRCAP